MEKRIRYNLVFSFIIIPAIITARDFIQTGIFHDQTKFSGFVSKYFVLIRSAVFIFSPLFFSRLSLTIFILDPLGQNNEAKTLITKA